MCHVLFVFVSLYMVSTCSTNNPLEQAITRFNNLQKEGCDVNRLPDSIDWCNNTLNKHEHLPEYTMCQSVDVIMLCRNRRWRQRKELDIVAGRQKRGIKKAVLIHSNGACGFICKDDSVSTSNLPPSFSSCPTDVTLHPEYPSTEVTYSWEEPQATDADGTIISVEQVSGPTSPATFSSSVTPGTSMVISYMATDNDNLNWPCTFIVTAEVKACSPIVHITNGNSSCNDENNRGSNCSFTCESGYELNGTASAVCEDGGLWSVNVTEIQCVAISCDDTVVNATDTSDGIQIECDNGTQQYESVCWATCGTGYILRNDELETELLAILAGIVNTSAEAYTNASEIANNARDAADAADDVASEAENAYQAALNVSAELAEELATASNDLDAINALYQSTEQSLAAAQQDADNAVANNSPDADDLITAASDLEQQLNETATEIEATLDLVNNYTSQVVIADTAVDAAKVIKDEADANLTAATVIADDKESIAATALEAMSKAMSDHNSILLYSASADKVVPTSARCQADGTWSIDGSPVCADIQAPEIECIPLFTYYLATGETSGTITWTIPEAVDNSGSVTVNQISGPSPGDELTLGQHIAVYQGQDADMNDSPMCSIVINVLVQKCGSLSPHLDDDNLNYECDGYDVGDTCTFTCATYFSIVGPEFVKCEVDSSSASQTPYWDVSLPTSCEVEACPIPTSPEHGDIVCSDAITDSTVNVTNNSTSNTTEFTCTVQCDDGYVLPYKADGVVTCNDDGEWSNDFPLYCLETGPQQYTGYSFAILYQAMTCESDDYNVIAADGKTLLETEITSYSACTNGYLCSVSLQNTICGMDFVVTIGFDILVTCDDNFKDLCDLMQSSMTSLTQSIQDSQATGLWDSLEVTLVTDWLKTIATDLPHCTTGVLVGAYCDHCPYGHFYNTGTDACIACPRGTFAQQLGSEACITCSNSAVRGTLSTGSRSMDQCIAKCAAGTYSHTSLTPCISCDRGTYQDSVGSTECKQCPGNTWTTVEGGSSLDDCIEYDLYIDGDLSNFVIPYSGGHLSVVFWIKNINSPSVTIGAYIDDTDYIFLFEVTETPQLIDEWDNIPTNMTVATNVWTMLGLTYDSTSHLVTLYQDGVTKLTYTINDQTSTADRLVITANAGTQFAGISATAILVNYIVMAGVFTDCRSSLPSATYSMDDMAAADDMEIQIIPSSCEANVDDSNIDPCVLHRCQNEGSCVSDDTGGYMCNCTATTGGPFCEEILVHGNWSEWLEGSACSVSCGNGTQELYRLCDNPAPSNYGNDCDGNSEEIAYCNLATCTECSAPETEVSGICNLDANEECDAGCEDGWVLPRGMKQSYKCGKSTQYEWAPHNRLPVCTIGKQPLSYNVQMTFEFAVTIPCDVVDEVKAIFENLMSSERCATEASGCTTTITISGCAGQRRKRATEVTTLLLVLGLPLTSTSNFDLPTYYATREMTDGIQEAVVAISVLELSVQDLLDNPDVFVAEVDGVQYTVLPDNILVVANTVCPEGQTPSQGVCAECQKGTYQLNGYCVYCQRNTYQPLPSQDSCIPCPSEHITYTIGARSDSECIDQRVKEPTDYTSIIIIVVMCVVAIVIIIVAVLLAFRFYHGAKHRAKYDMEADTVSLYTDFPDIAYNVYFKRRQVLGFDETGFPIISKKPDKNGTIPHDGISLDNDNEEDEMMSTKEPFAYPETDYQEPPFNYDPYDIWNDDYVHPYTLEARLWDFPGVKNEVRLRVPSRAHLQNIYPLQWFGLTDKIRGKTRRLLPLPVNIPVPKRLPQLLYRPPTTRTLSERLRQEYDIQEDIDLSDEGDIPLVTVAKKKEKKHTSSSGYGNMVPRLPFKNKKGRSKSSMGRPTKPTKPSPRSLRSKSAIPTLGRQSLTPRKKSARVSEARESLRSAIGERISPRHTVSAASTSPRYLSNASAASMRSLKSAGPSPRSVISAGPSPRSAMSVRPSSRPTRSAMTGSRMSRASRMCGSVSFTPLIKSVTLDTKVEDTEYDEDTPHPKPSRYLVPKNFKIPKNLPTMPKSSMKEHNETTLEPRPTTSIGTGRKSVTIKEGDKITRPATVATAHRSEPVPEMTMGNVTTDARSARATMVNPNSASHKAEDLHDVHEDPEAYTPSLSRIFTDEGPFEHPPPMMHGGVSVHRTSDYTVIKPPPNLMFSQPPTDNKMKFMAPPPFINKIQPSKKKSKKKQVWINDEDDDDDDDIPSFSGSSFFLTELPEERTPKPRKKKRTPFKRPIVEKSSPRSQYGSKVELNGSFKHETSGSTTRLSEVSEVSSKSDGDVTARSDVFSMVSGAE